jgi:hypothetical protein
MTSPQVFPFGRFLKMRGSMGTSCPDRTDPLAEEVITVEFTVTCAIGLFEFVI